MWPQLWQYPNFSFLRFQLLDQGQFTCPPHPHSFSLLSSENPQWHLCLHYWFWPFPTAAVGRAGRSQHLSCRANRYLWSYSPASFQRFVVLSALLCWCLNHSWSQVLKEPSAALPLSWGPENSKWTHVKVKGVPFMLYNSTRGTWFL